MYFHWSVQAHSSSVINNQACLGKHVITSTDTVLFSLLVGYFQQDDLKELLVGFKRNLVGGAEEGLQLSFGADQDNINV